MLRAGRHRGGVGGEDLLRRSSFFAADRSPEPLLIGMLERMGDSWAGRDAPVIQGDDVRPSALEPRVVFADGLWRIWYLSAIGEVGREEQPDYELRYAESKDGIDWDSPETFSTKDEGFFDNSVQPHDGYWEMILARGTNLYGTRPYPNQGLWWSESSTKPGPRHNWTPPVQFLDTDSEAESWFASGVCGPSFVRSAAADGRERIHVFATGTREPTSWIAAAIQRLRRRRRPPPPSPYYLAVGRFTFISA
jgi:hypothetical protein